MPRRRPLLTQAQNHFDRQDTLLQQGWTTRANHDQALKALQTAQAQVDAAQAQLEARRTTSSASLSSRRTRRASSPRSGLGPVQSCRPDR